ncbi:CDGSH iron-sulfur domain-containing protein 2 [Paroedura picta]|uniref:CDGSH iron-sulfur domain-containing protein 2 n=1 Tax=Paroedura picta TaxID=143630 RepID=UPI00405675FA
MLPGGEGPSPSGKKKKKKGKVEPGLRRARESGREPSRAEPAFAALAGAMVLDSLARIIKVQLPAYLKRLPMPESISGFLRLTVSEWLRLLPFLGVLALLGYLAVRPFLPKKKQQKDSLINLKIQKENPKVVNEINIEDLCHTKAVYCRCWRSKTFPVCDGSHNKHNESTGDNVGPLILKKKEV